MDDIAGKNFDNERLSMISRHIELWNAHTRQRYLGEDQIVGNYNVMMPMRCRNYGPTSAESVYKYDYITCGFRAYASADAYQGHLGDGSYVPKSVLDARQSEVEKLLENSSQFAIVVSRYPEYYWPGEARTTHASAARIARVLYAAGAYPENVHLTMLVEADNWNVETKNDLEKAGGILIFDDTCHITRRHITPEGASKVKYMGRNFSRYVRIEGNFPILKRYQFDILSQAQMSELNRRLKKNHLGTNVVPDYNGYAALYPIITGNPLPEEQIMMASKSHEELCQGIFLDWDAVSEILEKDAHADTFQSNKRVLSENEQEINRFEEMLQLWRHLLTRKNNKGEIARTPAMKDMADILSGRITPQSDEGKAALERLRQVSDEDGTIYAIEAAAEGVPMEYILA